MTWLFSDIEAVAVVTIVVIAVATLS